MHEVVANGVRLAYFESGEGPETVVFSHSYLLDHRHFMPQLDALSGSYRVLAYDHRDHGGSERVASPYGMEDIYADGVAFLEEVVDRPCHWVGLSTGGFVGLRMAIRRPELLRSLVVMDSFAGRDPLRKRIEYRVLFAMLGVIGLRPLLGRAMRALFGRTFLSNPDRSQEREGWGSSILAGDPDAIARFGKAITSRQSVEDELGQIEIPTLFLVGEEDAAIPPPVVRSTANRVRGSRLEIIEQAGHVCTVERPEVVTELLSVFFASVA